MGVIQLIQNPELSKTLIIINDLKLLRNAQSLGKGLIVLIGNKDSLHFQYMLVDQRINSSHTHTKKKLLNRKQQILFQFNRQKVF